MRIIIKFLLPLCLAALTSCEKNVKKKVSNPFESVPTVQEENTGMKLVFIPNHNMTQTRLSGRFQPNTLYWTNGINNPNEGPRLVQTLSGPSLEVQGTQSNPENKYGTLVTVYRSYPVPPGSKTMVATIVANQTHNQWLDKKGSLYLSRISTFFTKDGIDAGGGRFRIARNDKIKTYEVQTEVPIQAQNMLLKIEADNAITFSILDMQVEFK